VLTGRNGYVSANGFRLFFRCFGKIEARATVLCLHGGPGWTHDYLLPLVDLTRFGFRVVLYDQSGCGKSEKTDATERLTMAHAVAEVEEVRKNLRLGRIFLMGSSWGGMLALAYSLQHQDHLRGLIVSSGLASVPLATREMQRLKRSLPKRILSALEHYESRSEYDNTEYLKAVQVFYRRHLCRLKSWPAELVYSINHLNRTIYNTMSGPNEFTCTGTLRDWDITSELGTIRVPTLITVGRFDEITPLVSREMQSRIKDSRLVVFQHSSHLAMWEEREKYIGILSNFMEGVLA